MWMTGRVGMRAARVAAMFALGLAGAAPLGAQSGDGFLFGPPQGSFTLRGGYSRASAGSDLFDEVTQTLTVNRGDFSGLALGSAAGVSVTDRLDVTLDAGYMSTRTPSSYRAFVDNANQEIRQTTQLQRVPATLGAKLYLAPRGRTIGRFAWIPTSVAPWVGAGAGFMWYRFRQDGDFVDVRTNNVRRDVLDSDGFTPMAQGMAGVDVSLGARYAITGDLRYLAVKRPGLSADFQGYQPLDLSGVALSLGFTVRL